MQTQVNFMYQKKYYSIKAYIKTVPAKKIKNWDVKKNASGWKIARNKFKNARAKNLKNLTCKKKTQKLFKNIFLKKYKNVK